MRLEQEAADSVTPVDDGMQHQLRERGTQRGSEAEDNRKKGPKSRFHRL